MLLCKGEEAAEERSGLSFFSNLSLTAMIKQIKNKSRSY
jgi:hypothetical protein